MLAYRWNGRPRLGLVNMEIQNLHEMGLFSLGSMIYRSLRLQKLNYTNYYVLLAGSY